MRTAIVIPARYASSRLPGKPLLRVTGKYLIQHVYEQACKSKADRVLIATDDLRIMEAAATFGGQAVMTRPDHVSGTDRVAEVARSLDADIIINLQGDEPLVDPTTIDLLPNLLDKDRDCVVATLANPITGVEQWRDPSCVKVVCDTQGRAIYFSRSPIPYVREGEPDFSSGAFLQHLGIYAYRRRFLLELSRQSPAPLEMLEKLEQLRVLALGGRIAVGIIAHGGRGVDTPDDYHHFVQTYRNSLAA